MTVIEICTFTSSADVDTVRVADAAMQTEFAYQQPGLARRTTARDDSGRWCVVTLWSSHNDAVAADTAAENHPVAQTFWSLADTNSVTVQRFTLLE